MHVSFNEIHTWYNKHFSYIAAFLFWLSICKMEKLEMKEVIKLFCKKGMPPKEGRILLLIAQYQNGQ